MAVVSKTTYQALRLAVSRELESGLARLRASYQQELLRTYWNVGRVCGISFAWDPTPTRRNADTIRRLAGDLKRPERFFYDALKFYRTYPQCPESGLSWSHYVLLLKVPDARKRLMLERKAIRQGITSKDMRAIVFRSEEPGLALAKGAPIPVARGRLYYYRVLRNDNYRLADGRLTVDLGFGIEHEVKPAAADSVHSGQIVRTLKEGEDYSVKITAYNQDWLYTYKGVVTRVVDGDTVIARIDLGCRTWITQRLRLRAIDCPETSSAIGRRAKLFVQNVMDVSPDVVVKTYKDDKYGRMLADIFYGSQQLRHSDPERSEGEESQKDFNDPAVVAKEGTFLNQQLLDEGLAELWNG